MKLYNAYIKNSENGAVDDLVLIKNGTSYKALFFSIIWFIYHRMWKETFILFAVIWGLIYLQEKSILPGYEAVTIIIICLSLIIAVNANFWYSKYLQKRNYQFSGCVFGKNQEMAKLRFVEGYIENHPKDSALFSEAVLNPANKIA